MASVTASEIPEEQRFMSDFWNFRKAFYQPEDSDDYWRALIDEVDLIAEKYGMNGFFTSLLLAVVDDLEYRYRQNEGKEPKYDPLDTVYERIMRKRMERERM
jgi:hypothetical protein